MVLAGFDNGKFLALDIDEGDVAWDAFLTQPSGRTELDRMTDIDGVFGVIGNDVYVTGGEWQNRCVGGGNPGR